VLREVSQVSAGATASAAADVLDEKNFHDAAPVKKQWRQTAPIALVELEGVCVGLRDGASEHWGVAEGGRRSRCDSAIREGQKLQFSRLSVSPLTKDPVVLMPIYSLSVSEG
jgi:hypothetical protein